jgi:hypothetical protein
MSPTSLGQEEDTAMTTSPSSRGRRIESAFVIHPGEIRRVTIRIPRRSWAAPFVFSGWVTSDPPFVVVGARAGDVELGVREVPADVDPREEEWVCTLRPLPPQREFALLVRNTGARAARYRGHLR